MASSSNILVTGASGALGRMVVAALAEADSPAIAGSRSATMDATHPEAVRHIDFDDPSSLASSFAGVDRALLISTDTLDDTGRRQRQHRAAIEAAKAQNVGYLAYTSMPDAAGSPAIFFAPDHIATEQALRESGIPHGILRNAWYQENLLAYLPQIIADGTWYTIAGKGHIPHVARQDAANAAAALLMTGESGIFDISGPALLSIYDLAAAISEVLGRILRVEQVDEPRLARELTRQGVPDAVIPMVVATEANQRDGAFEIVSDDVERLTGRPATPFTDFLRAHAELLLGHRR